MNYKSTINRLLSELLISTQIGVKESVGKREAYQCDTLDKRSLRTAQEENRICYLLGAAFSSKWRNFDYVIVVRDWRCHRRAERPS